MLDHGNAQLSAVGFFNPSVGQSPAGDFFGGGVGRGAMPAAFELDFAAGKVVHCALVFGRATVGCQDTALAALGSDPAGIIYAKVNHAGGSSLSLEVKHSAGSTLPADELEASYRLLYRAEGAGNDRQWVDYRYTPAMFAMN